MLSRVLLLLCVWSVECLSCVVISCDDGIIQHTHTHYDHVYDTLLYCLFDGGTYVVF
jgi:hypothetical protein